MLDRSLDLCNLLKKKSFFLFGPRATGKSTLIKQQLAKTCLVIDLLRSDLYLRLSSNPYELESIIDAHEKPDIVVIDEVQKIPMLLNEVHRLIENRKIKFLLTGSSARKLKHHDVNLLAGRAWQAELFPLTRREIKDFDLDRFIKYGGLPAVYLSKYPEEELRAYVSTYLVEEIQAEALVRKLPAFSRFLQTAALANSKIINFSKIANDTGIPVSTIREYYQILTDTFIGFMLPAWKKTVKRKPISTAKFYFFDTGIKNTVAGIKHIDNKSEIYGENFEQLMVMEMRAYISYHRLNANLNYWRAKNGQEVDLVVNDKIAIEVKLSHKVTNKHLTNLKALQEESICSNYFLLSNDKVERKEKNISIMHWENFLDQLWDNKFLDLFM